MVKTLWAKVDHLKMARHLKREGTQKIKNNQMGYLEEKAMIFSLISFFVFSIIIAAFSSDSFIFASGHQPASLSRSKAIKTQIKAIIIPIVKRM